MLVDLSGTRIETAPEEDDGNQVELEKQLDPERAQVRRANRDFWQHFIDQARFDHPEQESPKHGGNNWVKIPMPAPAKWITAYRYQATVGVYLVADQETGLYQALADDLDALKEETGLQDLRVVDREGVDTNPDRLVVQRPTSSIGNDAQQIAWLNNAANRLINALRPRLSAYGRQ